MKIQGTKEKTANHKTLQLSREYRASDGNIVIEHSALKENPRKWKLHVKCTDTTQSPAEWITLSEMFPDATVVETVTTLTVRLNQSQIPDDVVLAAFGTPGKGSKKRTQLITFSKHFPVEGKVEVFVLLIDDTQNAFEGICARQEAQGQRMLAPMDVLFVSVEDEEDIKIEINDIEPGWKIDGKQEKVLAFQSTLKSAEIDIDSIPSLCFIFESTDISNPCLSCKIIATHTRDKAVVDVLKAFKMERSGLVKVTSESQINSPKLKVAHRPGPKERHVGTPEEKKSKSARNDSLMTQGNFTLEIVCAY